jgi:hypothetical protein
MAETENKPIRLIISKDEGVVNSADKSPVDMSDLELVMVETLPAPHRMYLDRQHRAVAQTCTSLGCDAYIVRSARVLNENVSVNFKYGGMSRANQMRPYVPLDVMVWTVNHYRNLGERPKD